MIAQQQQQSGRSEAARRKIEELGFQESANESASVAKGTPRELKVIRDHEGEGRAMIQSAQPNAKGVGGRSRSHDRCQ